MSTPVTLCGRLTRDPELLFGKSGTAIAKFSVVTSRRVKDASTGQWSDADTSFFDVTAFGAMAENICESLQKGASVIVTGQMRQEEWEKDGEKRKSWRVIADDAGPSCKWKTVTVGEGASNGGGQSKGSYDSDPPF